MNVSLIIPAYHANKDLWLFTRRCLDSVWHVQVQLVLVADNEPYAVNVNNGLKAATGDVIVVGNNDLVFAGNWLGQLLDVINKGYDIATCWTSDQDYKQFNQIEDDAKFGSLFAMKRKVYETIGGFDEQFKGYFSDLDYRRRVLDAGFSIGKDLQLVVKHSGKATYKQVDPDDTEFLRSRALFEAKWGFVE